MTATTAIPELVPIDKAVRLILYESSRGRERRAVRIGFATNFGTIYFL